MRWPAARDTGLSRSALEPAARLRPASAAAFTIARPACPQTAAMLTRVQRSLLVLTRQLGFRAAAFSLVGVGAALLARGVDRYLPQHVSFDIDESAISTILGMLGSSMLAVAIFSLSTLVAALAAATSNVTPRARRLLQSDQASLNALSTFVGAFLFSLVGLIALNTGYYGERGRLVLFVATLGMALAVVVTLLRWINHAAGLGGVIDTTSRVEAAARGSLEERARQPALGARTASGALPAQAVAVPAGRTGYLQHVDMKALQSAAADAGTRVRLLCLPGTFLTPQRAVAAWSGGDGDPADAIRQAITIDETRAFDQDPRFGLIVLGEVASRALSPAVNDPGTAIDVIGRSLRLLLDYRPPADAEVEFPDVEAPRLDPQDLVDDAFGAIMRDGAAVPAVGLRLQKALLALTAEGDPSLADAALAASRRALELAETRLVLAEDRQALVDLAAQVRQAYAGRVLAREADCGAVPF